MPGFLSSEAYRQRVFPGLVLAVTGALVGRGGLVHGVGSVYLMVMLLVAAVLLAAAGEFGKERVARLAAPVAISGLLLIGSIPLRWIVNGWDIRMAKSWCEDVIEVDVLRRDDFVAQHFKPLLAEYGSSAEYGLQQHDCWVVDRTKLGWSAWEFSPEHGWGYSD